MATLDLSAAFDIVNIELKMKRLTIIGIPDNVLCQVRTWLSNHSNYHSINGKNYEVADLQYRTIQGSILGPLLFAISPLFDIQELTHFADNNFTVRWSNSFVELIQNMKKNLKMNTQWSKDLEIVVNEAKTEMCLFNRSDSRIIKLNLNRSIISSLLIQPW